MRKQLTPLWTVALYVTRQKLRRKKRYPLVLMLEPLFRCNLSCAGCGKIDYSTDILGRQLTPEQCFAAARECGAPVVCVAGGEPLLHPQIHETVNGLVAMRRCVYLCTNAILLEEWLDKGLVKPSRFLSFAIHLDGLQEEHDAAVGCAGTHAKAVRAIRKAVSMGFCVTTNTTFFDDAEPERYRRFFDEVMALGVSGMMISPGYSYQKAAQGHFLTRRRSTELFRKLLDQPRRTWHFNHSPLFIAFLKGCIDFECTPWGNATYNVFGWQRPCHLLQDGYVKTFKELIEETDWDRYGRRSGNEQCQNCLAHCGYEASSMEYTFGSFGGLVRTAWSALTGRGPGSIEKPLFVPANRPTMRKAAL
ncbi:MAG: adenosyl-hopene transferase HpnH [Planctomycetota bacterium]|nr:adenosyl-hopene transferase HpnH [Planctomycetota bacterium]